MKKMDSGAHSSFPLFIGEDHVSIICHDSSVMEGLAAKLAPLLVDYDVLLLYGELGAGKTTFTQYLTRYLDVADDQYVSSPSFALLHEYKGRVPIFHMDLYRLEDEEEIEASGLNEYFDKAGVMIIEWPQRLDALMPEVRLDIVIEILDDQSRRLTLRPVGQKWRQRIACFSLNTA